MYHAAPAAGSGHEPRRAARAARRAGGDGACRGAAGAAAQAPVERQPARPVGYRGSPGLPPRAVARGRAAVLAARVGRRVRGLPGRQAGPGEVGARVRLHPQPRAAVLHAEQLEVRRRRAHDHERLPPDAAAIRRREGCLLGEARSVRGPASVGPEAGVLHEARHRLPLLVGFARLEIGRPHAAPRDRSAASLLAHQRASALWPVRRRHRRPCRRRRRRRATHCPRRGALPSVAGTTCAHGSTCSTRRGPRGG